MAEKEYIEREAVNALIEAECSPKVAAFLNHAIDNIPSADVRPVVRGKWNNQRADSEMCSACGVRFYISALFAVGVNDEPNFCPNCGADMREER